MLVCFVQDYAQLYGKEEVANNIHNLVHLADDANLHGPLDRFAAFPFENYLGQLKKMVRKPNCVIEQVIRRLSEKASCTHHDDTSRTTGPEDWSLKMEHNNGPLPSGAYLPCSQYRDVFLNGCLLSTRKSDNCVKAGDLLFTS